MPRYTFLTIQKDDVFEVPGEIIETYTNNPYSKEQFAALVRLPDNEQEAGKEDSERVAFDEIDGVGGSTAKNLVVSGYETVEDIQDANIEELSEVSGVGPATAENIQEHVE